jgi:hypothetical protein
VESLADDDQDPTFAVSLAVANETVHFAFRPSNGAAVQVALRFDLESRVFECVEDTRVCG